jgi:hypothetical protein
VLWIGRRQPLLQGDDFTARVGPACLPHGARAKHATWVAMQPCAIGIDTGLPSAALIEGHAMALVGYWLGAARGFDHVICLAVGTGVGGG